jgi:hypothetical protein
MSKLTLSKFTKSNKKVINIVLVLVLSVTGALLVYNVSGLKQARIVNSLIARNIDARGGLQAWQDVTALRLSGRMDLGQGMAVPYLLEQKRPGKMCLEFVFDEQTVLQCADGRSGWKIAPFRGRDTAEPMTEVELRETADSADLYGLLYNYADRGTDVELLGHETVAGRDAIKLKLTLAKGGVRWLYLDAETALEIKAEALRTIAGRQRRVETFYSDWQEKEGLLIARRQETTTEGDPKSHFLTVENVTVNPVIDDSRFAMPTAGASRASIRSTSL